MSVWGVAFFAVHIAHLCMRDTLTPSVTIGAIALHVAAFGLCVWALLEARPAQLARAHDSQQSTLLITTGPYRWVRHPIYVSYMLYWLGFSAATFFPLSWWSVLAAIPLLIVSLYVRAARQEERRWSEGPKAGAYAAYRARTGMFMPRLAARPLGTNAAVSGTTQDRGDGEGPGT